MKKALFEAQVNERVESLQALMQLNTDNDGTFHPMPWVVAFCFCIDDLAKRSFDGINTKKLGLKVKLDIGRALIGTAKSIEDRWDRSKLK